MRDSVSHAFPAPDTSRYRVEILSDVTFTPDGVEHGDPAARALLPWGEVLHVFTAEVGEPGGIRTVVFDLAVEIGESGCLVLRFDADPYDGAMSAAQAIAAGIDPERATGAIKSLAGEGTSTHWFPDLQSLAEAALLETISAP